MVGELTFWKVQQMWVASKYGEWIWAHYSRCRWKCKSHYRRSSLFAWWIANKRIKHQSVLHQSRLAVGCSWAHYTLYKRRILSYGFGRDCCEGWIVRCNGDHKRSKWIDRLVALKVAWSNNPVLDHHAWELKEIPVPWLVRTVRYPWLKWLALTILPSDVEMNNSQTKYG